MEEKRPIDRKREAGGFADIGTNEDGAIVDSVVIGNRLIIIKERSIYEILMADNVDPERTNFNMPPTIHKLISKQGVESEIVSRIFLEAKTIFKPEYYDKKLDVDGILTLTLDLLNEVIILNEEIQNYLTIETNSISEFERNKDKPHSFSIPAIGDIETRLKTIFQKADHFEQILMNIITIFYQNDGLTKQSHFPKFYEILKAKYGEEDHFCKFVSSILEFMQLVRELRNGLDHRLGTIKVTDFELKADGFLSLPVLDFDHKGFKLNREPVSIFLGVLVEKLLFIFENTIAYLAGKAAVPNNMNYQIRQIPDEIRRNKFVKYAFWSPIGKDGFYHQ